MTLNARRRGVRISRWNQDSPIVQQDYKPFPESKIPNERRPAGQTRNEDEREREAEGQGGGGAGSRWEEKGMSVMGALGVVASSIRRVRRVAWQ